MPGYKACNPNIQTDLRFIVCKLTSLGQVKGSIAAKKFHSTPMKWRFYAKQCAQFFTQITRHIHQRIRDPYRDQRALGMVCNQPDKLSKGWHLSTTHCENLANSPLRASGLHHSPGKIIDMHQMEKAVPGTYQREASTRDWSDNFQETIITRPIDGAGTHHSHRKLMPGSKCQRSLFTKVFGILIVVSRAGGCIFFGPYRRVRPLNANGADMQEAPDLRSLTRLKQVKRGTNVRVQKLRMAYADGPKNGRYMENRIYRTTIALCGRFQCCLAIPGDSQVRCMNGHRICKPGSRTTGSRHRMHSRPRPDKGVDQISASEASGTGDQYRSIVPKIVCGGLTQK